MRNINKLSPKVYLILSVIVDVFAIIYYRATLFQCLFLSTYNKSRVIFWAVCIVSFVATYLLTCKRRRNYLSVFSNAVLPLGIYTFMVYGDNLIISTFAGMLTVLLCGIYCFMVLVRPIRTDDAYRGGLILMSRVKSCINGSKTIAAVCMTVMLVSLIGVRAFDFLSFVPEVKPSISVAQDKSEYLEENMPVISKIDDSIWKNLSFDDRLDVLQTLANVDASQQGISHEINVCAKNLGPSTYGSYNYSTHTVAINIAVIEMDTATQSVETVCHEVRHAYQHDLTDAYLSLDKEHQQLLIFDDVRRYYENIEDYRDAEEDGFEEYESQIIEVDSRDYSEAKTPVYFFAAAKYLAASK